MDNTAWFLPVGSYAIVVKVDAVVRSFPGGMSAFQGIYSPIRKREAHLMILAFTEEAAERLLAELDAVGLVRGVDVAASDMLGRPWVSCAGIAFRRHRRSTYLRWMVDVCDDSQAIVEEPLAPAWIALVSPEGHLRYSIQDDDAGILLASRRGSVGSEADEEHLCAFLNRWGFVVGLYRYGPCGTFERACTSSPVEISDHSEIMVRTALVACNWTQDVWPSLQYSLQRLSELKWRTVDPRAEGHAWKKPMGAA